MSSINPILGPDNHATLAHLVKEVQHTTSVEALAALLPEPLDLCVVSEEDGCLIWIGTLDDEDAPPARVWSGFVPGDSVQVEIEDFTLGLNPDFDWAEQVLVEFFETVGGLHADVVAQDQSVPERATVMSSPSLMQ